MMKGTFVVRTEIQEEKNEEIVNSISMFWQYVPTLNRYFK